MNLIPDSLSRGRTGGDAATAMLIQHVAIRARDVVVHLNFGGSRFGEYAAGTALPSRVVVADRNIVATELVPRAIASTGVTGIEVYLSHGAIALPGELHADIAAVRIPQEKLCALQLLVDAFALLKVGGHCYLTGATNEGVKSAARNLQLLYGNAVTLAHQAGHRLVMATKQDTTASNTELMSNPFLDANTFHEIPTTLQGRRVTLFSRPGVFSWDHLDEASAILANLVDVAPNESVLDLGCGSGALGVVAAWGSKTGRIVMVDADTEAVRSAERTTRGAGLENVQCVASNVTSSVAGQRFDVVVTNPPFHIGKSTELSVPFSFIDQAHAVLKPNGRLLLVANRTLPYEERIQRVFGNVRSVHDGQRFKVLRAVR